MEHVARTLGIDAEVVREKNMYASQGAVTPYGQTLIDCHVKEMWDEVCKHVWAMCVYICVYVCMYTPRHVCITGCSDSIWADFD